MNYRHIISSRESYVKLAGSLMQTFGAQSGDLTGLKQLLAKTTEVTEGADYGALFMMEGAGAASVYTCAWSAAKNPDSTGSHRTGGARFRCAVVYDKLFQPA